jgi:dTDP-4-dehydrorhamnose 3,5-epimerase
MGNHHMETIYEVLLVNMKKDNLLSGLRLVQPKIFEDERGWFYEAFKDLNNEFGVVFLQDNHSLSKKKGTIRGLHLRQPPYDQSKLVRVIRGRIMDVVVDLRKNSKTFLHTQSFILDSRDKTALFVPKGFAHGFITLENNTEVYYKVDQIYSPKHEITLRYDDAQLGIQWGNLKEFIVSEKDRNGMTLNQVKSVMEKF